MQFIMMCAVMIIMSRIIVKLCLLLHPIHTAASSRRRSENFFYDNTRNTGTVRIGFTLRHGEAQGEVCDPAFVANVQYTVALRIVCIYSKLRSGCMI